jgi:hypothetical protein
MCGCRWQHYLLTQPLKFHYLPNHHAGRTSWSHAQRFVDRKLIGAFKTTNTGSNASTPTGTSGHISSSTLHRCLSSLLLAGLDSYHLTHYLSLLTCSARSYRTVYMFLSSSVYINRSPTYLDRLSMIITLPSSYRAPLRICAV